MEDYSIRHIYRSQNVQADILSKKGLLTQLGIWNMEVIFEAERFAIQEFSLLGTLHFLHSKAQVCLSYFLYFCILYMPLFCLASGKPNLYLLEF